MRFPLFALIAGLSLVLTARAADFDAARATNAVGLDLYRQLAASQPAGNLTISPYSIESALALVYAGADGATRSEVAASLRFPESDAALRAGFAALRTALQQDAERTRPIAQTRSLGREKIEPTEWRAANRLFGQEGFAFKPEYLALMRDGFAAPFGSLDFNRKSESSRREINSWVEEQTANKIKDLIPSHALSEDTRLVLVNTLYLKATWETTFEKRSTSSQPFYLSPDATQHVPTMHSQHYLGHTTEDGHTIVALEYLGRGLQFLVILPALGSSADAVAAQLTPEHFKRWAKLGDTGRTEVSLFLPKFTVKGASLSLAGPLKALGLKTAFDEPKGTANFARIAPRKPNDYLKLSEVFHQTYVAVDELGTEAAAATAAVMLGVTASAPRQPPVEVRVNRPFLYAIQHRDTGVCLFLGRVTDPR